MARGCQLFVAAPLVPERRAGLETLLEKMNMAPGRADPDNAVIPFGRIEALHFARIIILDDPSLADRDGFPSLPPDETLRLALIADSDGTIEELVDAFITSAAPGLEEVFGHCRGFKSGLLRSWMMQHRIEPAARYVNAPGRTARQVREEADLHNALRACRIAHPDKTPEALLPLLRLAGDSVPLTPIQLPGRSERLGEMLDFILPLLVLALLSPLLLLASPLLIWMLRRREKRDPVIAPRPSRARNLALARIEDRDVTNQYSAIGSLKPGLFRRVLTIAVLAIIEWGARHLYRQGRLARVNTIHAASWTFLDDKRRVFFSSNYDGSREAYNDDFINKVAFGLNASFSNGLGYPHTDWLILGGAWHEQDFKRYLFHHQIPTQVWYKPQPGLTNYDMARNARIRAGFERSLSGAALRRWLQEI